MVKLFNIPALMGNGILNLRKTIVLLLPAARQVSKQWKTHLHQIYLDTSVVRLATSIDYFIAAVFLL